MARYCAIKTDSELIRASKLDGDDVTAFSLTRQRAMLYRGVKRHKKKFLVTKCHKKASFIPKITNNYKLFLSDVQYM